MVWSIRASTSSNIGLVGTEEVYHATFALGVDGGIMVTASHNPREYNGMKFTRAQARPISSDTGLFDIEKMVRAWLQSGAPRAGARRRVPPRLPEAAAGHDHERRTCAPLSLSTCSRYIDPAALRPLKVVVNPGNGGAGPVIDLLEPHLPLQFVKINDTPDGTFPLGVPNPLLPENRAVTSRAVLEAGADLGIAWDGDFDRCFFFDEKGEFVDGYYLVGLLAQRALKRHPGRQHHPRPAAGVEHHRGGGAGGRHAGGLQERPRVHQGEDAPGGRRLRRRDVGAPLLPRVLVLRLGHDPVAAGGGGHQRGRTARSRRCWPSASPAIPVSGEINLTLSDPAGGARGHPGPLRRRRAGRRRDRRPEHRVSERGASTCASSNTEPVVRLNVETRADQELLKAKTDEIIAVLESAK